MKVYYLHLTNNDFDIGGNVWTTDVIDLYENDSYVNYSAVKSNYGIDSLGNRTWTGMEASPTFASPNHATDTGRIQNGRYIDHSGRIDLLDQHAVFTDVNGAADVYAKVNAYNIDDITQSFPNQWAQKRDIEVDRSLLWVGAYRYMRFEVVFDSLADLSSLQLDYTLRVEIDRPVMTPLYSKTQKVLDVFPRWMAVHEDSLPPATPQTATPVSLGGKLVNAVAGEWLTLLDQDIDYIRLQNYIGTADLNQVAWIYYASQVPERVYSIYGDGIQLTNSVDLTDFYKADLNDNVYYWDEFRQNIYTRKQYNSLEINGEEYSSDLQQVWNWFDEHATIVDLERLYNESNYSLQQRILDVYINEPGPSLDKFKLALRREFDLWKSFAAVPSASTPDSYALGATPTVLEMIDIEELLEFVGPDGMPSDKFIELVEDLAEQYPVTWGFFRWDQARWDTGGEENKGFGVLPYRYDATPSSPSYPVQAGIGDGPDLFVYRPDEITGPREFNYRLKVRGRQRSTRTEYPPITINFDVYGLARKKVYNNPRQQPWFTMVVQQGGNTYYLPIRGDVTSNVDTETLTPTSNSYNIHQIIGPDNKSKLDQTWYDQTGAAHSGDEATPFYIDFNTATNAWVQWGRFNPATQTFVDYPVNGSVTMWFSDAVGTTLVANNSNTQLSPVSDQHPGDVVIVSNLTNFTVGDWESERVPYSITINGALPAQGQQSTVVPLPVINWSPNLEAAPNKRLVIQLKDQNAQGLYIVNTVDSLGQSVSLSNSVITVSGNNAWSAGKLQFTDGSISQFAFSSGVSANPPYPMTESYWTLFEANEQDTRYGVVDENGPWRHGKPQEAGGFNFLMEQAEVSRADFGLSNSVDYIITWMGVEVLNNSRVTAWLDTNVVNPATDDDNNIVYADNTIVEEYNGSISNYDFSPFFIRARLRPEIDPQWYPQIHSGWYYQNEKEKYLYASATTEYSTPTKQFTLSQVARQGAPVILKTNESTPQEYRQVVFFDEATPELSLTNKETIKGTDTNNLYASYDDIYDVVVTNLNDNSIVSASTASVTNRIVTLPVTSRDIDYEIEYKLNKSYYIDHDFVDTDKQNKSFIKISEATPHVGNYTIDYEASKYDPATPIDVPLNTFYTIVDEGFIYLSHNEYDLAHVEVKLSPSKFLADGEDYMLVSVLSYDENGNPKANQSFDLTASFGAFEDTGIDTQTVITNEDGFATAILISESNTNSLTGYIEVDGPGFVDATINYEIDEVDQRRYRLTALPTQDALPADGESKVAVYGRVEDDDRNPVPYAAVTYKRHRSMPEVFTTPYQGQVVADSQGRFTVPEMTAATPASPGYWFMQLESWHQGASPSGPIATPNYGAVPYATPQYGPIGDVVFWYEYPEKQVGVNAYNQLPPMPVQQTTNPTETVYYSGEVAFPVTYSPSTPVFTPTAPATPVTPGYTPPPWYGIDRYTQYQLGLLGTIFYKATLAVIRVARPFWKDL